MLTENLFVVMIFVRQASLSSYFLPSISYWIIIIVSYTGTYYNM